MLGPSAELAGRVVVPQAAKRSRSKRSLLKARIASALCLVPTLYCAGIVVYALFHWSDYGSALPQFLRYIVVPAVLAGILTLVAFRASRMTRVNVGGIACGLLGALFVSEAILEARYLSNVRAMLTASRVDQPAPSEGIQALPPGWTLKRLNREIGTERLADAVLGNPPGATVNLCMRDGQPVSYTVGPLGFRNPEGTDVSRPNLMLIGDSFVEGICLPKGLDLAGQIRKRNGSLVSLGTRGAGPLFELAVLGRYGPVVRPRWTVIAFYEGNDWENLSSELRAPWLRQALAPNADFGPIRLPREIDKRASLELRELNGEGTPDTEEILARTSITRNFLALHQTWTQLGLGYPTAAHDIPEYDRILRRSREIAASWGGRVAIVYIPQNSRYIGVLPHAFVYDELRTMVRDTAGRNGIPFIDLTPAYSAQKEPLAVYGENHLTPQGTALSAEVITRALRKLGGKEQGA